MEEQDWQVTFLCNLYGFCLDNFHYLLEKLGLILCLLIRLHGVASTKRARLQLCFLLLKVRELVDGIIVVKQSPGLIVAYRKSALSRADLVKVCRKSIRACL